MFVFSILQDIDAKAYTDKLNSGEFKHKMAEIWAELIEPYVPFDTGELNSSVTVNNDGEIVYSTDYASYVYEGNFDFQKTNHPLASREWDKAAEPSKKPELISRLQDYIKNGGLEL